MVNKRDAKPEQNCSRAAQSKTQAASPGSYYIQDDVSLRAASVAARQLTSGRKGQAGLSRDWTRVVLLVGLVNVLGRDLGFSQHGIYLG